jgi:hypothetical protein
VNALQSCGGKAADGLQKPIVLPACRVVGIADVKQDPVALDGLFEVIDIAIGSSGVGGVVLLGGDEIFHA